MCGSLWFLRGSLLEAKISCAYNLSVVPALTDIGSLIVQTPEIHGGRPRIAGTGVTVSRIVQWYRLGLTPEEIADRICHLSLAQVYGALAYYHANRETIDSELANIQAEAERLEQEHTAQQSNPP